MNRIIFLLSLAFISFVQGFDIYTSIRYEEIMPKYELNPIGQFLIRMDGGHVALFMACKAIGFAIVMGLLVRMYMKKSPSLKPAVYTLVVIHLLLILFLNFGHLIFPVN